MDLKPKRRDIYKYVKPHAYQKWDEIGMELEVGDEDGKDLDQIRDNFQGDKEECFKAMIGLWLQQKKDPSQLTWKILLDCLRYLGLDKAVKSVQDNVLENVEGNPAPPKQEPHPVSNEVMTSTVSTSQPAESTSSPTAVDQVTSTDNIEQAQVSLSTALALTDDNKPAQFPVVDTSLTDGPLVVDGPPLPSNEAPTSQVQATTSTIEPTQTSSIAASAPIVPPSAVDGPAIPIEDTPQPPLFSDYSLFLEKGESVRGYQEELAQLGKEGKNYIVVAPTGSGKTLVAALVISDHLQKGEGSETENKVVFVVEKRPLAQQQSKELQNLIPAARVVCCTGDVTGATVKDSLDDHNIIVCTAGKLFDDIKGSRVSLQNFSLMVFDECHHTRKKSPYAELMIRYLKLKDKGEALPQVMGLTASPGAGENRHLEKTVTIEHLTNLCALMDATSGIKTVRKNKAELEDHTNKPDYNVENSKAREGSEPFIVAVTDMMKQLEKEAGFTCPFERWSQKYETHIQQKKFVLEQSTSAEFRNQIRILELLRTSCRALDVYMELQYEDAVSVLKQFSLPDFEQAIPFESKLRLQLNDLLYKLAKCPRVDNPHLEKVKLILREQFSTNPDSRVMLFVRTKKHATSIHQWISHLDIAKVLGIRPCMVVGQDAGTTGDGMTQAEQEDSFKSFREGRSNVLVVTSIGEEGIDVPACNIVLRYQHVSNEIAKAQTLGRARAPGMSEGYTILSSHSKHMQEVKNGELLALVDEILQDSHFPAGKILLMKIEKAQAKRLKQHELELMHLVKKQSTYKAENVQLLCKACKVFACSASDVRTINNTARVVPDEGFQTKIILKKHPKPLQKAIMSKTHKIHCKNCEADWGNSCIWPTYGLQYPVLKCQSFVFVIDQTPRIFKKWSDVPFTCEAFDGFRKPEDNSDESV